MDGFIGKWKKEELTPLVAHQHWTGCMSGAVVSLSAGKQIVPEDCSALECTQTRVNGGQRCCKPTRKRQESLKVSLTVLKSTPKERL